MITTRTKIFKNKKDISTYIRDNYKAYFMSSSTLGTAMITEKRGTEQTVYAYFTEKRKSPKDGTGWYTVIFSIPSNILEATGVKIYQKSTNFNRKELQTALHTLRASLSLDIN